MNKPKFVVGRRQQVRENLKKIRKAAGLAQQQISFIQYATELLRHPAAPVKN